MADLCSVLNIEDPTRLNTDQLWAPARRQGPGWMRFPIGLYADGEELVELDLRTPFEGGMGLHGLVVGTCGAGKTSGVITEVMSACLTHSPEELIIAYAAGTPYSAAETVSRFPHVVAAVDDLRQDDAALDRFCDVLEAELDRRDAMLAAIDDCRDVTAYNQRRLADPDLAAIPVLWVIVEDYDVVFADPIRGMRLREVITRIARVGRSLHVFFQLVGQTKDTHGLRGLTNMIGYTIAARTATLEDSRAAIGATDAALIPSEGQAGTAYLRTSGNDPRRFRYFSAPNTKPLDELATAIAKALRAATDNPPAPL